MIQFMFQFTPIVAIGFSNQFMNVEKIFVHVAAQLKHKRIADELESRSAKTTLQYFCGVEIGNWVKRTNATYFVVLNGKTVSFMTLSDGF